MSIGKNIRKLRVDCDMTQVELAKAARIGQGQLSEYEKDAATPSIEKLARIADALHVSVAVLDERLRSKKPEAVEEIPTDLYLQEIFRCWKLLTAAERAEVAGHASRLVEEKSKAGDALA